MKPNLPSPIQHVTGNLYIKREDLIHPLVSGNKFRKLKYNILLAKKEGITKIVSFGGAYSNHIHALAYACKEANLELELYVRGDEVINSTINKVREFGAEINWMNRQEYRQRNHPDFIEKLKNFHPNSLIIPEGGTNPLALLGLKDMMEELYTAFPNESLDIIVAYGSGGTSLGMMQSMKTEDQLHIVPVLNFPNFRDEIQASADRLEIPLLSYEAHTSYHFGGYAKFTPALIEFIHDFYNNYGIPLDPIYTGKVAFATLDLIKKGILGESRPIVMIHTGGLQGIRGFNERFGMTLKDH